MLKSEQARLDHQVEFVYCDHGKDNLDRVADAVIKSGGDVIAIEKIAEGSFGTGTRQEKADLSEAMTRFISLGSVTQEEAGEYFGIEEPFFEKILNSLRGSGKIIRLIDMATDDKEYDYYREVLLARKRHSESASPENYQNLVIASALSNEQREYVMARQIESLVQDNPGSKITVMAGAVHTPISHELRSSGLSVRRIFVPTLEEELNFAGTPEVMRYTGRSRDVRQVRFELSKSGFSTIEN